MGDAEVVTERFSLNAFGEESEYSRTYTSKTYSDVVCYIIAQVADEEHEFVAAGFDMVAETFRWTPSSP